MASASEKTIFLAALELKNEQDRCEYLEQACAGNPQLRDAVSDLLNAHERADNVLDSAPPQIGMWRAKLEAGPSQATLNIGQSPAEAGAAELPGTIIGPYKLIEQIGEGGFGYVYVAEQLRPVRRRVALKILKPGMRSEEVIARFEAERQALALMDHPNIAQVFDAGTADGKPYFVMELVQGVPVTQFCQDEDISIRERLELFIHICNAVQHAHQKGIIHRDLKPPNVLVTQRDGMPVVKVIDFGVAKAMSEPLTAKKIQTQFAQLIGTPLYMSPEQIELSGLDVDTRSDIYSLGVLLYEMLTGITPFDQERLASVSFDELRRIIREEEPLRPSAQLTTVRKQRDMITTWHGPHSRSASLEVQGDLDWIVMKALEKERSRRYETAAELAADVRRYLNQEPIAARPPSPLYRFGKFARRNKIVLTAATVVLATMILGTGVSTWQAIRATRAQEEADRLKQEAIESAENLKQANVLLDVARANADNNRWATAYLQHTRATQLQPDHYPVWSGRAVLFVRLGLWERAAGDYAKALELGAPANNPGWWGVPQLCLYAGDEQAYRTAATQMLDQFKGSSDTISQATGLRSCLMQPRSREETEELVKLAEVLLRDASRGPSGLSFGDPRRRGGRGRGGPPNPKLRQPDFSPPRPRPGFGVGGPHGPGAPWELPLYVAGLAHFRAGHIDQAIEYLQESARAGQWDPIQALSLPALAMVYQDASRKQEAQTTLEQAQKWYDQWLDSMVDANTMGWMPLPWFDFIEFLILYGEAHERITGSQLPVDPRLETLERSALEAIGVSDLRE